MNKLLATLVITANAFFCIQAFAYPLDGSQSGIQRLNQTVDVKLDKLTKGANWSSDKIQLRLLGQSIKIPASDAKFERQLGELLGEDSENYGLAILDLTEVDSPFYAEINANKRFNPGSVAKLFVGLAIFQAMADHYPLDIEARKDLLRNTLITADRLIESDHHDIPIIDPTTLKLILRKMKLGDQGNMWTYMDWMFSASSNAAASMLIKELILMQDFADNYEKQRVDADAYLNSRSKSLLSESLKRALQEPIKRNGMDNNLLQQGGFFTHVGKKFIPGTNSYATPAALIDYLVKLEQGKLVDEFSSLELKRLLYITQKRIRYASSPELTKEGVFFKSGSLYRCKPEPGFVCKKYSGNVENLLNSVAIIESPKDAAKPVYYLVALTSNVLRKNSAVEHQNLASKIHQLIISRHHTRTEAVQQK